MDNFIILNTGWEALISALTAAFFAQVLKVVLYFTSHRKINFKVITTTGGMPSSHSAGVLGLSISIGIIAGYSSLLFAVSLGYAIVVMYDAAGLRRAAGKTAATLNRLVKEYTEHNTQTAPYEVLKELLGHTPSQVIAGAVFGACTAYCIHGLMLLIY
jgi:acid phosphatase family membrane protein YuiD